LIARWGGEEFLAVLPETDATAALAIAERLRFAVEQLKVALPDAGTISVTASAGVATWVPTAPDSDRPDWGALLRQADDALYRAKAAGRNRVEGPAPAGDGERTAG
jgi:two-component system cell cycle response regulator